jgi:Mrp family chromosome partitioning ATPase
MLPAVREAFRTLLIQLGPHPEGRAQVIMVTSASTGDGKTTSAVNLAAAAAASGDPVILLDFDLRKPDVGRTLGVQPGTELTGLLQPDTQLRDLLSPAPGLPALSVLTTTVAEGDVALVEALSRRLPELIADARDLCNYVVIDTAPLGEISDALRLVADVDDIIVVTKPGNTNRANFEMMRDLLERTAYTPAGFLVIGDSTPRTSAYYAYGATGRELFLEGPPTPSSERPRPAPTKSSNEIVAESARVRSEPRERDRGGDREERDRGDRDRGDGERPRDRDRDRDRARNNGEGDAPRQAPEPAKAAPERTKAAADRPKGPADRPKGDSEGRSERNGESNGEADANRAGAEASARRSSGESHRRPTRPPRSDERERPSRDKPSKG